MELLTEGPSGAARVLSAAPPAPEPAPAGQAYLAMTKSIGTKPVDADSMATALLEWETIDSDQIDDIMDGRPPRPPKDWTPPANKSDSGGTPAVSTGSAPAAA